MLPWKEWLKWVRFKTSHTFLDGFPQRVKDKDMKRQNENFKREVVFGEPADNNEAEKQ